MLRLLQTLLLYALVGHLGPAILAAERSGDTRIIHLTGIGGKLFPDLAYAKGLKAAGLTTPVDIIDWTGQDRGLVALQSTSRHTTEAQSLAAHIVKQRLRYPNDRLIISGHSGGAGIAVWALEQLPADVKVDRLVLLAPALSPTYDLSAALKHVAGDTYVFCSENDSLVLGTGTRLFGTIDGQRVEAAGKGGFVRPEGADRGQYDRLEQFAYRPEWMAYRNIGDHIGCMSAMFAQQVLGPLLLNDIRPTTQPTTAPASRRR